MCFLLSHSSCENFLTDLYCALPLYYYMYVCIPHSLYLSILPSYSSYSSYVQSAEHYSSGQYESAVSAPQMTMIWNIASMVVGICAHAAAGVSIYFAITENAHNHNQNCQWDYICCTVTALWYDCLHEFQKWRCK